VNELIDFPKKCPEYIEFFINKMEKSGIPKRGFNRIREWIKLGIMADYITSHDGGRVRKTTMNIQLEFLDRFGEKYLMAWFLHHLMDYMDNSGNEFTPEEIFNRIQKRFENNKFPEIEKMVIEFVKENYDDIMQDLNDSAGRRSND